MEPPKIERERESKKSQCLKKKKKSFKLLNILHKIYIHIIYFPSAHTLNHILLYK